MPNTIKVLCEIQKLDIELDAIAKEKERFCKEIEDAEAEAGVLREEAATLEEGAATLKEEKKEVEEKIRQNKERIEKDQLRLTEVKNDKQHKAVTKEISNAEKAIKLLDMEAATLSEKIDGIDGEVAEKTGSVSEKEEKAKLATEEVENNTSVWEETIKAKQEEKDKLAGEIKPAVFKKYEMIKERRAGVALVEVRDEACQGCYIHVPPQVYIQLIKGSEEIIPCPHCHRILYFNASSPSSPESESETTETKPETPSEEAPSPEEPSEDTPTEDA